MRLARKLTLALVFAVTFVLAGHGLLSAQRERQFFEADTRRDARVMGRALVGVVAEIWRTQGQARALEIVGEANEREALVNFRYVSLVKGAAPAPEIDLQRIGELPPGREAVFREVAGEGKLLTYVPMPIAIDAHGAIEVSSSLAEQQRFVRKSALTNAATTLATTSVVAAITILLGAFFVGRPMRDLIAKARRIGSGDLTGPLVLAQRDELGELAGEINAMCERLADERSARQHALDQLRHAHRLALVGRLGAGVAHELGTPLNVVSGWAQMIASREVEGDGAVEAAKHVASAASRMAHIIRQLLDFSRRRSVEKEPESLERVVDQVRALLAPIAEKRKVVVEIEAPEREVLAEVDASQLQQAVTNLVINGIDAMRDGGKLTISIGEEVANAPPELGGAEGNWGFIRIRDEGTGMAPDLLEQIFEPFFTTKGVGEGTGLGLSVSYGIVQEHGGFIAVESTPGHGSCFTVYLPKRAQP